MWPLSCSTTVVSQSCSSSFLAADLLAVEHAGADQRPVMVVPGIEEVVEIDGLVRAMEIADAEMHDAGAAGRRDRSAALPRCREARQASRTTV